MDLDDFYKIDFLTSQPSLFIFGHSKNQTKIGVFFSILVFMISLALGIYFFYVFITRSHLNIVYMKETNEHVTGFDLGKSLFIIYLTSPVEVDTSIIKIGAFYYQNINGTENATRLELQECTNETVPEDFHSFFDKKENDVVSYLCLKTNQTTQIEFDQEKGIISSILIKVALCNIDTDQNCKSHEYIENLLSGQSLYFTSIVVNNNIDHYNRTTSLKPYYFGRSTLVSYDIYTAIFNYWVMLTYTTDDGIIFDNKHTDYGVNCDMSLAIESSQERLSYGWYFTELAYFEYAIYPYYAERYDRTYDKFQSIIANIGGVLSVVQTAGIVIVNLLTRNMIYTALARNVANDVNVNVHSSNESNKQLKGITNGIFLESALKAFGDRNKKGDNKQNNTTLAELGNTNEIMKEATPRVIPFNPTKKNDTEERLSTTIDGAIAKQKTNRKNKQMSSHVTIKDFFFYSFGCKKSSGSQIIEVCEKITKESLSCEQIIKNNISIQKMITLMSPSQRKEFYEMKPDFIKELEKRNLHLNMLGRQLILDHLKQFNK